MTLGIYIFEMKTELFHFITSITNLLDMSYFKQIFIFVSEQCIYSIGYQLPVIKNFCMFKM